MNTKNFIIMVIALLLVLFSQISCCKDNNIIFIEDKDVMIYADLNGNGIKETITISQSSIKRNNDEMEADVSIKIHEKGNLVYNYSERDQAILYIKVVRFVGASEKAFRDIVFIVVEPYNVYMNLLCWEYTVKSPVAIMEKGLLEGEDVGEFGKYKYIKTKIQLDTPYG